MNPRLLLIVLLLVFSLLLTLPVAAQDDLPAWEDLPAEEWTQIMPGGDTICSIGTPYAFFVRPADAPSDKLAIYLQGGGACWFGDICSLNVNPTFDPFVDDSDEPGAGGIFDYENPENPVADYNVVFLPYCTADVHLGQMEGTYTTSAGDEVTIFHQGHTNVMTVLDWTFAEAPEPSMVFVAGSSAGSIPSPFYTEFVAEAYPEARVVQLGDGSGGYRNPPLATAVFTAWGTMDILTDLYEGITVDELTFESFYTQVGAALPNVTFSAYNTAYDDVQIGFLQIGGLADFDLWELLQANYADILEADPDFVSFTVGGELHTILGRPELYTYAADGVRFVDWLTDLLAGETVETVDCGESCDAPEIIESE